MKKIMFNDKYGLTQAVLEGRKTQTRRIISKEFFSLVWDEREDTLVYENSDGDFIDIRKSKYCHYKEGKIVAIARSYKDMSYGALWDDCLEFEGVEPTKLAGWNNKMFVRADYMLHRIRINKVRIQRLQEISDNDCIKEGIFEDSGDDKFPPSIFYDFEGNKDDGFDTPREAYAALIDKISGKGTWESNPYVCVYEFELVKWV